MGKKQAVSSMSLRSVKSCETDLTRRKACGACDGCRQKNCGKCKSCKSMICFGGTGTKKHRCVVRVCNSPVIIGLKSKQGAKASGDINNSLSTPTGKASQLSTKLLPKSQGKSLKGSKSQAVVTAPHSSNKKMGSYLGKENPSPKRGTEPKGPGTSPKEKKVQTPESTVSKTIKSAKKKDAATGTKVISRVAKGSDVKKKDAATGTEVNSKVAKGSDVKKKSDEDNTESVRSSDACKPASIPPSKSSPNVTSLYTMSHQGNNSLPHSASAETMTPILKKKVENKSLEVTTPTKAIPLAAANRTKLISPEKAPQSPDVTGALDDSVTMTIKKDIQLPKVKLDSMTKNELKEFIPRLLKLVTGREEVFYSRRSARPEWWPEDVPWAASRADWYTEKYWMDNLKSVVKNCYKYAGKEDLIQSFIVQPEDVSGCGELALSYPPSPLKMRSFPQGLFLPFSAEIYICFFCEKEFLSKDKMRSHQKGCIERPPYLQSVGNVSPSESNLKESPPCMSPKRAVSQKWSDLTKTAFSENIGLVPKHTAAKLREQRPSLEEINCEILDEIEPMSPVTPKTPKSLMSQLSRDDSSHASRKRLSYSLSMDKPDREKIDTIIESESESDSETETGLVKKPVQEMNLLDIPISSLLGQRVKNNIHVDSPLCIVEDTGSFCRTPVKNSFLEKLRKKPMAYPVLYRPRRISNLHKQNHIYRFKKSEVKEFMCRANYGLNLRSIEKLKLMKKFSIRLRRMSRKRLLEWLPRRRLDRQFRGKFKGLKYRVNAEYDDIECEFPSGPTLLAKNIDKLLGLKKRNSQQAKPQLNHSLSLSNCISEEMEAEVSKQKLTLYRSLLYEMSVLKAAVVIEDIGKHETIMKNNNTVDRKDCQTPSNDNDQDEKTDYPNLRTILLRPHLPSMPTPVSSTPVSLHLSEIKQTKPSSECSFSVMSGSSDSESLLSSCCQACSNKKLDCPCCPSPSGDKSGISVHVEQDRLFHEPLHVQVDMPVGSKTEDYGIPSPVSVSSESPYPPSPFKSENTPQGKSVDLSQSSFTGRETRLARLSNQTPVSSVKSITKEDVSKVFNVDSIRGRKKVVAGMKRFVPKIEKKMTTRSCSVTPSGSPMKRMTRLNTLSLPSSPCKSWKPTRPLDVKRLCKKLRKSSDSVTEIKFKRKLNSLKTTMSPKSGSPLKSRISSNRAGSNPSSPTRKLIADNCTPPDTPARRIKRKASLPIDKVYPSKLRKIVSDNEVNKR